MELYPVITSNQLNYYYYFCNVNNNRRDYNIIFGGVMAILVVALFVACGSSRNIPEGSYSLENIAVEADNGEVNTSSLVSYVRQKPNTRWFSLIKRPGAKPVIYDTLAAMNSAQDLRSAVRNMGFLHAEVDIENKTKGNKLSTKYKITTGAPYYISDFQSEVYDDSIKLILDRNKYLLSRLRPGRRFSVVTLSDIRKQLTTLLIDSGYYHFHKDFIKFDVDTAKGSNDVGVMMSVYKYKPNNSAQEELHRKYRIGKVSYTSADGGKMHLRQSVLENTTDFKSGDLYSAQALQKTYNNFSRLQAVRYTNIRFDEHPDDNILDCAIQVSTNKPSSLSFQPEGTNTAGDLGAALSLTYENRNLFRGSELLSIQTRAAFEAITGLEGYQDQNYQEYSVSSKLSFPRCLAPFLSSSFKRRQNTSSELQMSYNLQNRPEFHRRLFSSAWRYRWTDATGKVGYRFDLIDLNYVYMPWISETFRRDYLESTDNRNAILRYNYEDLFIMKIGFGVTVNHSNFSIRTNLETAGNVLHGASSLFKFKKNSEGQNTLFNIAYAQYVKGDVDYTKLVNFDENNQLAFHAALGVAYPYGNSKVLPFEKRYFSGGANSVRGWSVRSLGPGSFKGTDGRIDFINQTGDIKLDLSMEYRSKLFWKLHGAAFIDAGNIWTIREYEEQPGGQFSFNEFYKQLAVAYGVGLRFNFDYFILRFDFGMKAVNPVYNTTKEHYPLLNPKLSRDLAFHFAVGMPF